MDQPPNLDPLFAPKSVAVVGASPDSTYSSALVDNLIEYGFDGDLSLVNPGREEAWGRPCYDDLADVPGDVDLAVVAVPREHVVDVVRTAGKRGVPVALVISAGFAEADATGRKLEGELGTVADEYGVSVCGPNCIGVADANAGTVLTSTCTRRPNPGSIGLVSQSGALAFTTFYERAADEDVDFAAIASTGNEVDLTLADYVGYMTDRSDVEVICAYVEGTDDPDRFVAAAERAVRQGTPVLAVKVGRSDVAEAATLSHTGSLTGDDDAWEAAFEQSGVERVPDVPDLIGRASAHAAFDPPGSRRVCVVSTSGGLASLLADLADERELELPPLPDAIERRLLDIDDLLTFGEMHNPADIRGYGAEALSRIADVLFDAEPYDAYVFGIGLSAVDERAERVAAALRSIAERAPAPVLFLWTGRKEPVGDSTDTLPYERLRREEPLFYDPARCMDALASLVNAGEATERLADEPARANRRERARVDDGVDVSAGSVLTWTEATALLEQYGVQTVDTRLATSAEAAADLAVDLGWPVAMKVDSRDVPHRTDAEAVRTDVTTRAEARSAYEEIVTNVRAYDADASVEGVLVQEQVGAGVEALIGVTTDDVFGPLLTVAPGGTLVEALEDAAVRLPPVTRSAVEMAIDATALSTLLSGHRARERADRDAFVDLVRRVGDLAVDAPVAELDLNPVIVRTDGVAVVDALVRTE